MKFLTQIDSTDPAGWMEVFADDVNDAAIKTLTLTCRRKLLPIVALLPCTVHVGESKILHKNGTPFLVHALKLERGKHG